MTATQGSDPYSGHVEPGSEWIERTDGTVMLRKMSVGPMDNNVYLVACATTQQAVLIDAPSEPARIRTLAAGMTVQAVLITHGHADHVGAWHELRDADHLELWGNAADDSLFPGPLDRALVGGQVLTVGELTIEVVHLPGHTPGSLLYLVAGDQRHHLFSGDTLFPGGHGRTTTPEDHERIMDGLEALFDRLPDETHVYPGHGDDTTIGTERPHLREWRERGW